ncbi:hypothetical protein L1887_18965 [Cichorium endivia]|nr:hypothetical protein L1887_18965 [Cichorium endivia]
MTLNSVSRYHPNPPFERSATLLHFTDASTTTSTCSTIGLHDLLTTACRCRLADIDVALGLLPKQTSVDSDHNYAFTLRVLPWALFYCICFSFCNLELQILPEFRFTLLDWELNSYMGFLFQLITARVLVESIDFWRNVHGIDSGENFITWTHVVKHEHCYTVTLQELEQLKSMMMGGH